MTPFGQSERRIQQGFKNINQERRRLRVCRKAQGAEESESSGLPPTAAMCELYEQLKAWTRRDLETQWRWRFNERLRVQCVCARAWLLARGVLTQPGTADLGAVLQVSGARGV